jgi:FtsP/CotA-like multicopper oxidase with cupredoxin domain
MPAIDFTSGSDTMIARRRFLVGAGLAATYVLLPRPVRGAPAPASAVRILRAQPGSAHLRGPDQPPTAVWGYDGTVPGPVLRVKRGQELHVRLVNDLPEETTLHWHGLRLPNAMDGVPHLTQAPIPAGGAFDYRFVAPDAGTFWYHPHLYASEQLDRGLSGVLIVEEPEPVAIDRDVVLVLDDWRLKPDGANDEASFRSFHDAAHAGRIGAHLTVNARPAFDLAVKTNERLRLRIVNAANARVMPLRFDRHRITVMAIDGQPAEPFVAREGRAALGPGNRVDLFVDCALEPGASAPILLQDVRAEVPLGRFVYDAGAPVRSAPLPDPKPLPANPLPARMDFRNAYRLDVPIEGGAMSQMMMDATRSGREIPGHGIDPRARLWTMAGQASSGHHGPPLFSVKRGRTVTLAFANRTAFPHGMHVHGHHFRLLDNLDDGWKPHWLDTVMVAPRETARIAFVADNPGKWMIHCHMLEHHDTGMGAWFEVT